MPLVRLLKYSLGILFIFSCSPKLSQLEINFTSKNKDTITEVKALFLNELPILPSAKKKSFTNIKCITPNKFVFTSLQQGKYYGLMQIEYRGSLYNITIDSINIDSSKNKIYKEISFFVGTL